MAKLEYVVYKTVKNLQKSKTFGVFVSDSTRKSNLLQIDHADEAELRDYISNLTNLALFYGIEPAKESWHQINGLWRPIVNAGIIEVCKVLPYLPGLDKNNLYRAIGIEIGHNTTIAPRVQFDYFHPELIEIGDNCLIGDSVKIWTHDYGIDYFGIGSVVIGDNVRVGSEASIFSSRIGDNVEINFRAFLYNQDIPNNEIVRGQEKSTYS